MTCLGAAARRGWTKGFPALGTKNRLKFPPKWFNLRAQTVRPGFGELDDDKGRC